MKNIAVLFLSIVFFFGCACGNIETESNVQAKSSIMEKQSEFIGQIIIVGNEPFTELALMIDNSKILHLKCSEEIEKALRSNQGKYYKISGKIEKSENTMEKIIVTNAEKLRK